jgi:hypothetical protein
MPAPGQQKTFHFREYWYHFDGFLVTLVLTITHDRVILIWITFQNIIWPISLQLLCYCVLRLFVLFLYGHGLDVSINLSESIFCWNFDSQRVPIYGYDQTRDQCGPTLMSEHSGESFDSSISLKPIWSKKIWSLASIWRVLALIDNTGWFVIVCNVGGNQRKPTLS